MIDEEMAEEWVKENMDCVKTVSYLNHDCNYFSDEARSIAKSAFKDGYNKANEWHYVKDGDLPQVKTWVIGFYYGKDNWHKIFYRADGNWWGEGQLCQPPYAWKEIVLPGLEENKE